MAESVEEGITKISKDFVESVLTFRIVLVLDFGGHTLMKKPMSESRTLADVKKHLQKWNGIALAEQRMFATVKHQDTTTLRELALAMKLAKGETIEVYISVCPGRFVSCGDATTISVRTVCLCRIWWRLLVVLQSTVSSK